MPGAHEHTAESARVYSIPPDVAFLETLAQAVLTGDLPVAGGQAPDPLDLPRWTIYLPTRRAVRSLSEAFLKASDSDAMLLPRIRAIGDVDEDELLFAPPSVPGDAHALALDLPPAIGGLERRLVLSELVLKWRRAVEARGEQGFDVSVSSPAQASLWAKELADLMDSAETEGVKLTELANLAVEDYAGHWQDTLTFLEIVTQQWPAYLEDNNQLSPYARSEGLIRAEAERLTASPPDKPVIAAGSTGSRPATAALLKAIATLPKGAVVLPGVDFALDDDSWDAITKDEGHAEHPQYGLAVLLNSLDVARNEVLPLGIPETAVSPRAELISEVMRPARTTQKWESYIARLREDGFEEATAGITRIDAPGPQAEAEAIALILRGALETKGQTAALVTPDRTLARRVAARLEKWNLAIDDSAGRPLAGTVPGTFTDLIAQVFETDFAPVPLMALLKHPLTRLGREASVIRAQARLLELAALRRPFTGLGLSSYRTQLDRTVDGINSGALYGPVWKGVRGRDLEHAAKLLEDIETAFAPLTALDDGEERKTSAYAKAHAQVAEALARDAEDRISSPWRGDDGEALALHFAELIAQENAGPQISATEYPDLYRALTIGIPVRVRRATHPRLFIWGPLEARLQRPDVVVLGGLNEDSWPAVQDAGPWLSRPMMAQLKLPLPERRIGLAAHDVSQLMGARRVYLTRSEKVDGAPGVPSRWLLRLDAILGALEKTKDIRRGDWLSWAAMRDTVKPAPAILPPAPCPPLDSRPKQLSVTRIEQWIANPYAIFAHDILKLRKLDPLIPEADSRLRGVVVHEVLNTFTIAYPDRLPETIADEVMRLATEYLATAGADAPTSVFWRPHLVRFAQWFAQSEPSRREGVARAVSEISGRLLVPDTGFTLTARADRIDIRDDGSLAFYDYKTGTAPTAKKVAELNAPQLPLEALIAAHGGFEDVPRGHASRLAYIRFLGRGLGGDETDVGGSNPDALASEALKQLQELVRAYADAEQAYAPLRRSGFKNSAQYRYDDYAHLARIAEWSVSDGGEGEA